MLNFYIDYALFTIYGHLSDVYIGSVLIYFGCACAIMFYTTHCHILSVS